MSSSSSASESTLSASLQCPVCYEMYATRIFQCCQGHSVCDKCYGKITDQKCPQCRCVYIGTRNYILEDMIKALKALKNGSSSETDATNKERKTKTADEKFTLEITKLVNLIPSVEEIPPVVSEPPETELVYVRSLVDFERPRLLAAARAAHVPQPAGRFHCRMLQCEERVPICRMWNHIRTFHANHMVEQSVVGDEYTTHFTFPYDSYRRALHIPQFGLFFFIVNVELTGNSLKTITAWVQMVGRREECRRFSYELNLHVGSRIATYKDLTYGDWSEIDHIQSQAECLTMKTNQINTTRYPEIEVTLSITKLPAATYSARSTETRIEEVPNRARNARN